MIMMDFMKAYDRIDITTMIATLKVINVSETILDLVKLLYENSTSILILKDETGNKTRTKGGVCQGFSLSPYLFIIVLELMAIKMRMDRQMKAVKSPEESKTITSYSKHLKQKNISDDRLSMFVDDSSTITSKPA